MQLPGDVEVGLLADDAEVPAGVVAGGAAGEELAVLSTTQVGVSRPTSQTDPPQQ